MNSLFRPRRTQLVILGLLFLTIVASTAYVAGQDGPVDELSCEIVITDDDTDGDGLSNMEEGSQFWFDKLTPPKLVTTNPERPDTDGDGLCDGDEVKGFEIMTVNPKGETISLVVYTDPSRKDTDGDGFTDRQEKDSGTDPQNREEVPDIQTRVPTVRPTLNPSRVPSPSPEPSPPATPETTKETPVGTKETPSATKETPETTKETPLATKETPSATKEVPATKPVAVTDPSLADTDEDGIPDAEEVSGWPLTVTFMGSDPVTRTVYSNPLIPDTDGDGRTDDIEKFQSTDPSLADSDGDGLTDAKELQGVQDNRGSIIRTLATKADTDQDGLSDGLESVLGTNPMQLDSDGDGLTDGQEVTGMPVTIGGKEVVLWSNPLSDDSDGDGLSDSDEINGFPMTIGDDKVTVITDPLSRDTDGDGLSDNDEKTGTRIEVNGEARTVISNPTKRDTDGDTISDGLELQGYMIRVGDDYPTAKTNLVQTNPMEKDTDGDGKNDDEERDGWAIAGKPSQTFWTDPTLADTDGDGKNDASPGGGVTDDNPVKADPGIAGWFLGPLRAGGIPYSLGGLLIIVAGAGTFLFAKLREDTSGDSSQRRLRDQGRELDESRRSLNDLQRESAREIGQLRSGVDDRDRRLHQLEAQLQTYQGAAQRREQELGTTASRLAQSANELGEREWVAEIVANLPSAAQPGNGLDDRFTVMTALGRRLDEIRGQATTQRVRARDLISDLRRLGLETDGIGRALESAPATALPSLIGSLEELVRQHTVESMDKDRLLSEIQRAEGLCNREITDAVGRRVPLQFLARARELVEQATSQAEMNAAIVAGDRILDDIYRFYFPRSSR